MIVEDRYPLEMSRAKFLVKEVTSRLLPLIVAPAICPLRLPLVNDGVIATNGGRIDPKP